MTGAPTRLRQGGPADMAQVMSVMSRAFEPIYNEAWSLPQCQGILGMRGSWLILAERGEATAGFALGRMLVDEAELLLLGVAPGLRREGIGSLLIDRAKALAAAGGATRLFLEVRQDNPALALYHARGFAQIGRRREYYRYTNGDRRDALTLACAISS